MRKPKPVWAGVTLLALIALLLVVYFNAQALEDWWRLRGYNPPAAIASLAVQDDMTAYAKHVFYVNHPDLESSAGQFRSDCGASEKTIILGCYHSDQDGIFLYDVQDPRLNGVEQVTAAHEMLHAAYDRLSSQDKNYVDNLLLDYYHHDLRDQRIIDTINTYKQSEPNDVVNEMHSVFGTGIANLPPPLETYYQRYFSNRQQVAAYANAYEGEFTSRQDQIQADDAQLAKMKTNINTEESDLRAELSQINSDRAQLDGLRSSGQIAQYNASVAGFNSEVDNYNNGVGKLRSDIAAYNQLVGSRNAVATDLASLSQALDTRLTPQAAQ